VLKNRRKLNKLKSIWIIDCNVQAEILAIAEIAYLVTEYHSALIKYSIVEVFLSAKRNFKNAARMQQA